MFGHKENPGFMLTGGKGFQIMLANGMTVSVQWGAGNYCQNNRGDFGREYPSCADAETAVWDKAGKFIKREVNAYDEVQGHQSPDKVAATIAWAAALPADSSWAKKPVEMDHETIVNHLAGLEVILNDYFKPSTKFVLSYRLNADDSMEAYDVVGLFCNQLQDNHEDLDCIIENTLDQVGLRIEWVTPTTFWFYPVEEN